jgi:hypothetical protein
MVLSKLQMQNEHKFYALVERIIMSPDLLVLVGIHGDDPDDGAAQRVSTHQSTLHHVHAETIGK